MTEPQPPPPHRAAHGGLSAAHGAPAIDGQAAFVPVSSGVYRLETSLTFATAPALHGPGLERIAAAGDELQFDLQPVTATDSAGLALLVNWLAAARARQCTLRYVQPPEALLALARLSDVESLLDGSESQRPSDKG
ncbi:MAG TPA: STAS domain-containing protein [Steroidobacteraceae bacterium]|jgi:phospholipid transport system transporter-binding protein|nr:STAS domain-containing protein [Steroidobacteraceae bacterium]